MLASAPVRRVSVVGTSGSGKSTLGAALAARLGVEFIELDAVYHQADWEPLPTPEFRRRVAAATASEGWVIDGGYSKVRDIVLGSRGHRGLAGPAQTHSDAADRLAVVPARGRADRAMER